MDFLSGALGIALRSVHWRVSVSFMGLSYKRLELSYWHHFDFKRRNMTFVEVARNILNA